MGRKRELAALDAVLDEAVRAQAPRAITIIGPLGSGKTRLLDEWLDRRRAKAKGAHAPRIVRASAAPASDGRAAPALVAALLRDRFQLTQDDGRAGATEAEKALQGFRAELQRVFGDRRVAEVAALLGGFLGLEMPASPLVRALASKPGQATELSRAVLGRFLEQDARQRPLVMVAEDLQHADDEALDTLQELGSELAGAPILLVGSARPELLVRRAASVWGRACGAETRLDLAPLPPPDVGAMIQSALGAMESGLPPELIARAAVESGGNPFLVEQLLRVYLQHGILAAPTGEAWWFDVERAERERMALTPEEAAQSRIATLSATERDVLARGAVFGGVFWTGGVVALGRLGAAPSTESAVFAPDPAIAEIQQMLADLEQRDYVVHVDDSPIPGERAWGFKHALEQSQLEAAVDPELTRRRKAFAAQWLESRGGSAPERREALLEALARLYEQAGDRRRSAYCLVTAAAGARARLLPDRAHVLYLAALRSLDLDDAVARMDALYAVGDLAARLGRTREALGHFGEMLRVAWRLDLPAKGGAAHGRIGRLHELCGEHARALEHLELARRLFTAAGDQPGIAAALDDIGRIHLAAGAPEASLEHHRAALAVRERLGDDRGRALTLACMGQVEHDAGSLAAANEHFRQALELRRQLGDRSGVVASLLDLGRLERDLGRLERARELLVEGRLRARDAGERLYESSFALEIADCYLAEGQPRRALKELKTAVDVARRFGARLLLSRATRALAEAELAVGDTLRARDDGREAFDIAQRIGAAPQAAGAALRVVAAAVGMGAPGEADLGGAREMFDRAVEILAGAGAELELGRALHAYADFEERVGREEVAAELRRQADLITTRSRAGVPPPSRQRRQAPSAGAAAGP